MLADVAQLVRSNPQATMGQVNEVLGRHNRAAGTAERRFAKKHLLPGFLDLEKRQPGQLAQWGLDGAAQKRLFALLRMKPRRTASGVATITVLTKPWPCSSSCDYCPNDIRMPKSYLAGEPACQRAERNFFDPYLQVHARLHTLDQMGHPTDKVELIVLGGTWSDYPLPYQTWFMEQLFSALNDGDSEAAATKAAARRAAYREAGFAEGADALTRQCEELQARVRRGEATYNQAVRALYGLDEEGSALQCEGPGPAAAAGDGLAAATHPTCENAGTAGDGPASGAPSSSDAVADRWRAAAAAQTATWQQLFAAQAANETAGSRCVGLVVETRPTLVSAETLSQLRAFGCTKVQMGIQTLNPVVAAANHRIQDNSAIARAFSLLRRFGFKIHAHFMANLQGATPETDSDDFRQLVEDPRFLPDEVKLYPCVLVAGTALERQWRAGRWNPYPEDELVGLLAQNVLAAPPYLRISRMIRDISAPDIMAGSKKTNLRQMVEEHIRESGRAGEVQEIRFREIAGQAIDQAALTLETVSYHAVGSREHFLQWVTDEGKIAGFLRLSLPEAPAGSDEAGGTATDATADTPPETKAVVPDAADSSAAKALAPDAAENGEVGSLTDAAKSNGSADAAGLPEALRPDAAMIREVHVYGTAAQIHGEGQNAQHTGLGRALVVRACHMAADAGFSRINVISAVGTREYYRNLGFSDNGLYLTKDL